MDIPREQKKKPSRYLWPAVGIAALAAITFGASRLQPRAPSVERGILYVDEVRRGEMLRQVRGPGTLVPEDIRWISAVTSGRVDQILAQPGDAVDSGTVILLLSNPDVQMEALEAQRQLSAQDAALINLKTSLETQRLAQELSLAQARGAHLDAQRQVTINEELARKQAISDADLQRSREIADEAKTRQDIAQKQLELFVSSIEVQIEAQTQQVQRARAISEFQATRVASMRVTAGAKGVLTELPLEIGQWANSGATLAKVVQPGKLKAVLRIPENQATEVSIGQSAEVDTRNGVIPGRVTRIDPAAQGGSVTIDVALEGPLPQGARPDLNVDGMVELARLPNVLYMARPSSGGANSTIELFKLTEDGRAAERIRVTLGQVSVSAVEIVNGLSEGDRVVLGDMSDYDDFQRLIIK